VLKRPSVPAVRAVVEPRTEAGRVARTGTSDLEVGSSARSGREWDGLAGALDVFALIETTADHVGRARQGPAVRMGRTRRIGRLNNRTGAGLLCLGWMDGRMGDPG